MVQADLEMSFSFDTHLTDHDIVVNRKLDKLRNKLLLDDPVLITASFYEKIDRLLDSDLY